MTKEEILNAIFGNREEYAKVYSEIKHTSKEWLETAYKAYNAYKDEKKGLMRDYIYSIMTGCFKNR